MNPISDQGREAFENLHGKEPDSSWHPTSRREWQEKYEAFRSGWIAALTQAPVQAEPVEVLEFTTGDSDLDALLSSVAHMQAGKVSPTEELILFTEALEAVQSKLTPAPAQGSDRMREALQISRAWLQAGFEAAQFAGAEFNSDMEKIDAALSATPEQAVSGVTGGVSAPVVVTTDSSGRCVLVSRQDEEGRILEVIWEASKPVGLVMRGNVFSGGDSKPAEPSAPGDFFHWLDAYCLGQTITEQFLRDEYARMVAANGPAEPSEKVLLSRRQVMMICDRYESGYGHGLANDGLGCTHADKSHDIAYELGYEAGQRKSAQPSNERQERKYLIEVLKWIDSWEPDFVSDPEWKDTRADIDAALQHTSGKGEGK